jgi:hypothetical protein
VTSREITLDMNSPMEFAEFVPIVKSKFGKIIISKKYFF